MVYIASFDIGKKNFAFYVENLPSDEIEGWNKNKVPVKNRYYKDGTMTEEWKSIVDEICFSGEPVLSKNYDLTEGEDIKTINRTVYNNMYKVLDLHKDIWEKCSYFVIEKQMSWAKSHNTMALKLGQHCYSYFCMNYKHSTILEFPAYHKTQVLGAEKIQTERNGVVKYKSMDKPSRKKWAVEKALEIVSSRGDTVLLELFSESKKKDDIADTVLQLQAFKVLNRLDL